MLMAPPRKPTAFYRQVGARIKDARLAAHLTQTELAEQIGVTDATLSRYESGSLAVPADMLKLIAGRTARPVQWFYGEEPVSGPISVESPEFERRLNVALMDLGRPPTPEELESIKRFIRFTLREQPNK